MPGRAHHEGLYELAAAEQRVAAAAAGSFAEASFNLLDIAEKKLYRQAGHTSFSGYVKCSSAVLGFGLRQARGLLAGARFMRSLPANIPRPSCERQMRPLVGCHFDVQLRAWIMALERAGGPGSSRVSGRLVLECLKEVRGPFP